MTESETAGIPEAERAIADVLLVHSRIGGVRDIRSHCVCGWSSDPSPDFDRSQAHRAHVASLLADLMAERQAEAWDEGYGVGRADGGDNYGWGADEDTPNPYRPDPKDTRDE